MVLVTVSGVSAAVTAPILVNTSNTKQIEKGSGEEVLTALVAAPSVEKCVAQSKNGSTTIDFGDSGPSGVCWAIEGNDSLHTELSKVFTLTWSSPSKWVSSGDVGQIYCKNKEDDEGQGSQNVEDIDLITLWKGNHSNCSGFEYLELQSNDYQNTIFLKKELNSSKPSSYNVWLCTEKNCWDVSPPFSSGQNQQIVKETRSSWKPVIFRKR